MAEKRLPDWLRMPTMGDSSAGRVRRIISDLDLNTVCVQARCPNRGHCYQRGTATFLILGRRCTRNCAYCAIERGVARPGPPDPEEPSRIAEAAERLALRYAVITSVTRDDLEDGGALHFARTVSSIGERLPGTGVEVLTPDFRGRIESLEVISDSGPSVFNHNLETVRKLFDKLRPMASYSLSLKVLETFGRISPGTPLKSGIMLGLGEDASDVHETLRDLRNAGVSLVTMGQYLQPTSGHIPPSRFVTPEEFEEYRLAALEMGFADAASGPLVRSSWHADMLGGFS